MNAIGPVHGKTSVPNDHERLRFEQPVPRYSWRCGFLHTRKQDATFGIAQRRPARQRDRRPPVMTDGVHKLVLLPCCLGCGKRGPGVLRCTSCKAVWFCGRECQRALWRSSHRHVCGVTGGALQQELLRSSKGSLCLSWVEGRPIVVATQDMVLGAAVMLDTGLVLVPGVPDAAVMRMCASSNSIKAQVAVASGPLAAMLGTWAPKDGPAFAPRRFSLPMHLMFGSGRVRDGRLFCASLALMRHACVPTAFVTVMEGPGPRMLPLVMVTLARDVARNTEVTVCYGAGLSKARCSQVVADIQPHAQCTCRHDRAEALHRAMVMVGITDEDIATFMQRDFRQGLCLVIAMAEYAVGSLPLGRRADFQATLLRYLQPFSVCMAEQDFEGRVALCRQSIRRLVGMEGQGEGDLHTRERSVLPHELQ